VTVSTRREDMLERERVANRRKHWVRLATACNSRCLFCLDSDTPRNLFVPVPDVLDELRRGRDELDADKVILSGGEGSLHPEFIHLIAQAKGLGYDRVQTVTNGYFFGDPTFYEDAVRAGLGEITFSIHGHTAELHDRLTGTEGAFERIVAGIRRAARDRRVICNVDVVINKQNVAVLDQIVELCIGLGVTEFDLLHVIPQAAAYDHRDELFYDPAEHLDVLHKVFRLGRHPRFVIWTNRFPVPFLEGLEDLIQDPHKMLDEVNGRRFQLRRYLDAGEPLDCREPDRCQHCFIEPFCTTTDRTLDRLDAADWDVWWVGPPPEVLPDLPFGCARLGVEVPSPADLPTGAPLYARVALPGPLPAGADLLLVASEPEQLEAWLGSCALDIELNRRTAPWLLAHRERLSRALETVRIVQPSWEHMQSAVDSDVRDPAAFFLALDLPVAAEGLAACQAPGARLVGPRAVLEQRLFDADTGRPDVHALAADHVRRGYRVQSLRCRRCVVSDRCDGVHVNMVRDQGLRLCRPLVEGAWPDDALAQLTARWPDPQQRVATGRPLASVVPSLPGYPPPATPPTDPLASLVRDKQDERARRRLQVLGGDP